MTKLAIILGLFLLPLQSFALPVSHKTTEFQLNRGSEALRKNQVGTQIVRNKVHVMRAVWDYSVGGGASTAAINLTDYDGKAAKLPSGAIIKRVIFDVITAPQGNDAGATLAFSAQSAGDLKAATASTSWSALVAGVPVGSAATSIKLTAERTIQLTVATQALIGGKINCIIEYYLTD